MDYGGGTGRIEELSFVHKLRANNSEWTALGVACERHPGGNGGSGTHCRAVLRVVIRMLAAPIFRTIKQSMSNGNTENP
jgi:hypothetical protein